MEEIPRDPPLQPGERIEHHEVTERVTPADTERVVTVSTVPARRGTPMWAWVLPLVIVVIILAWYIFTRGEPSSPLSGIDEIEIEAPEVELPAPNVENTTIIDLPEAAPPAPAAGEAESAPAEPPAGPGGVGS